MKSRRIRSFLLVLVLFTLTSQLVFAEEGVLFRRNISKTPGAETEKANIFMMDFYVPAQAADGTVGPVTNYILDDDAGTKAYDDRDYAKPLVSVYIDEIGALLDEEEVSAMGGIALGEFDAFVAVSLDDGTTWRNTNLSRSSDLSSFTLENGHEYKGGVHALVHQVAGDRIFVAWASKYCDGGTPLYTLSATPTTETGGYTYGDAYLDDLKTTYKLKDVYLVDYFGVNGKQRSVDYTEQGYPEVGEIPFSCVWTARGKLIPGDDPSTEDTIEATHVVWTKPERLTSGRRDANLPAVDCAAGAGCVLTWQEDPDGLRPGQGLGPGEGWSGAIANQQTDMWYSYIAWDNFDDVQDVDENGNPVVVDIENFSGDTMPKVYVPMAMPIRLTDNHMCKTGKGTANLESQQLPYCFADFSTEPVTLKTTPDANSTFCSSTVAWTNPGGTTLQICKTPDGRILNGRIASTRTRWNLKPYKKTDGSTVAWVVMAYEETKAMGDVIADGCTPEDEAADKCDPIDIGKDVWYHSFDMFKPDMIAQGGMLNQPAVCKKAGEPYCSGGVGQFYAIQTDPLNGGAYYLTEIARRFALTTNSVKDAVASESGLSGMLIYKQGIINQGGPADVMLRRLVIPEDFNPEVDNPYAYKNMDCGEATFDELGNQTGGWAYTDGTNPNYLKGVCLSPAINITGNTIVRCDGGTDNDTCAGLFPMNDDGSNTSEGSFPKVYEWRQCDGTNAIEGCEQNQDPDRDGTTDFVADNDLDDQTWENPYDVAKGHRGFLDEDIVMIMYAWAPNWNSNTVGNDHYNLYVRRSFDGGVTWTTTPATLGGDGTTVVENYYGTKIGEPVPVTWNYGPGEFEQGRNVSQLIGNKITILDPRYSPAGGMKLYSTIRVVNTFTSLITSDDTLPYPDEATRARDKFFVVYETGDNTTVAVGEAIPLDLYYSRGTNYGDDYEVMDYYTSDGTVKQYWPWLENKQDDLSGEAGMVANPGGTFCYVVWNQWKEEILPDGHELIYDSDIIFRRVMYQPDVTEVGTAISVPPTASILYVSATTVSQLDGDVLTLAGTARDFNAGGIVAYKWTSSIDGVMGNEQVLKIPAADLSRGRHTFTFSALDGQGHWSRSAIVTVNVVQQIYRVMLPMVMRNK